MVVEVADGGEVDVALGGGLFHLIPGLIGIAVVVFDVVVPALVVVVLVLH